MYENKPGLGYQNFEEVRTEYIFYIDKTDFIREWWEYADKVTLITRPRRFGKTLNMSMTECFFSNKYAGRSDLFEGLSIWEMFLRTMVFMRRKALIQKTTFFRTTVLFRIKALLIKKWFGGRAEAAYNDFVKALLLNDLDAMNEFMSEVVLQSFSNFDIAKSVSSKDAPERFYHGFVLGLMVELSGRFQITSNRESGFGRYDIMLTPSDRGRDNAYIIEFKVHKPLKERDLEETVANALKQIDEKQYEEELLSAGFPSERIRKYGFAFRGKECLIG